MVDYGLTVRLKWKHSNVDINIKFTVPMRLLGLGLHQTFQLGYKSKKLAYRPTFSQHSN